LEAPGYEADDLLGTLARMGDQRSTQVYLMTGDKDALQLVSEYTSVLINKRGISDIQVITPQTIMDDYGLTAAQFIDFKALKGDSSDNIPGVAGVGDKTAMNLLSQFPSLDAIYDNLDQVASKSVRSKLEASRDKAFLSRKLVTINCEVPMSNSFESLHFTIDWSEVVNVFQEFQFTGLVKRFSGRVDSTDPIFDKQKALKGSYKLINSLSEVKGLLKSLKKGFAVDLETTSLVINDAQIVGIAITTQTEKGVYIALNKYLNEDRVEQTGLLFSDSVQDTVFDQV
jgi:5''-3'' exonuclease (including N-terminal domain of PolI)